MKVSFIVVAYNAENTLKGLFQDLNEQDYKHELIEVILVDSNSSDNTKNIMKAFQGEDNKFYTVKVLDNPKKILPCGWNVALKQATGEVILRVDAHTSMPKDFITNNIKCISSGEKICGGKVTSIVESDNKWQEALLVAENSALGGGIATFRRSNEKKYVSTLAFASYSKDVFDTVGLYNECLARTEDNEMHHRMKKAGYKFCLDPSIRSERFARNSLMKMIKQKYLNGYWIGLTLGVSPKCFSLYHFVPLGFVVALLDTIILSIIGYPLLLHGLLIMYTTVNILLTILCLINNSNNLYNLLLPFIFGAIHLSYGIGTLVGVVSMPRWLIKNKCKREVV